MLSRRPTAASPQLSDIYQERWDGGVGPQVTQTELGTALGLTFQQIQKYEKGANRVSASRLQHLTAILGVPISFFLEGAPTAFEEPRPPHPDWHMPAVNGLLATTDGLALIKAFASIRAPKVRRAIVALVEQIAGGSAMNNGLH
jgi:transcriptional regulator with XRE-family HTH domain